MKNVIILHGTSSNSSANWFPWLKRELEKIGYKVWVPDLPQSESPSIERYNNFLLSNKEYSLDSDSVLIGHSSGAVAILGILQALSSNVVIDKCILVGSFKDNLGWDSLKELFLNPFDFEKIRKRAKRFIFIHSDNDPYCPLEHAEYLSEKLDGKLVVIKGQGHFSGESVIIPEIIEELT